MAIQKVRVYAKNSYTWDSINKRKIEGSPLRMENLLYASKPANQRFPDIQLYYPTISNYAVLEFDNPLPKKKLYQDWMNDSSTPGQTTPYELYRPKTFVYLESLVESNTADGVEAYTQTATAGMGDGWVYRLTNASADFRTADFNTVQPGGPTMSVEQLLPCVVGNYEYKNKRLGYGSSEQYGDPQVPIIRNLSNPYAPPAPPFIYRTPGYYYDLMYGVAPNNLSEEGKEDHWRGSYRRQIKFPSLVGGSATLNPHVIGPTMAYSRSNFVFHNVRTLSGHQSTNPPYMEIYFEDVIPYVTSCSPQSGFINEHISNTFYWSMGYDDDTTIEIKPSIAYSAFQWREANSANINTIPATYFTSQNNVALTIPPGTFPNGNIQWRAMVSTDDNIASEWTQWFDLTTIDAQHYPPTPLNPSGVTLDGSKQINFNWITHSPIGTPQLAYELEISYDLGINWEAASGYVTSTNWGFSAAPDAFRSGRIGWRVRTYNSDNVASQWSGALYFNNKKPPKTPNWISIEQGKARPKCTWSSVEQVSYQLEVLQNEKTVYSIKTFGTELNLKIPIYLNQGSYVFKLRIQNNTKLWSEWATTNVSVFFQEPISVNLTGESKNNSNILQWETEVKTE